MSYMTRNQFVVLVMDNDPAICKLLQKTFMDQGLGFHAVSTGKEGLDQAIELHPDLVILELDLPDIEGKEVIRKMRKDLSAPVIVLTSRDDDEEKIATLDAGAEDFITKPFNSGELLARVRAILRRCTFGGNSLVICKELRINLVRRRVAIKNKLVRLTPAEYSILEALAKQQGRVLTYPQLLEAAKSKTKMKNEHPKHCVQVYVAQLRRKMADDPANPRYIITEYGIGYRLANP